MLFSHERSSITHQIIASVLYTELAWFRGFPYTFPVILLQLERKVPHPDDVPLPECPKESWSRCAVGHKENCQVWWCYLLMLLQYWKDVDSPYPYGGLLHHDSKLMMFLYYQIKHLLFMGKINLHHYSIKNQTPWTTFARQHYSTHQVTKQWETYATICEELAELKDWLLKCYEVELDAEVWEVEQCCEDLWRMSLPRNSADQCPGNEDLFVGTDKRGTCQPGMKIHPAGSESYPDEGNNLARRWHWESESLERKKYALSQHEGASLDMCIPLPKPIDKSKKALEQVSMKKKSITVDEYQARDEHKRRDEDVRKLSTERKRRPSGSSMK